MIRCSKNFDHDDNCAAIELLIIVHPDGDVSVKPRCAKHPAADDVPLVERMAIGCTAFAVPLPAELAGR